MSLLYAQLLKQYNQHGKLLIAFDFDDTVFPLNVGAVDVKPVHKVLQKAKAQGHTLIMFTCRHEPTEPLAYCHSNNIAVDYFNTSPVLTKEVGLGKIYYNVLLDDKAGLEQAIYTLNQVLDYIEQQEEINV